MTENHDNHLPQQKNDDDELRPKFMTSFTGRTVSVFGLVERIVKEFELEHGADNSETVRIATDVERRQMVLDVAEYIFGIESMRLSPPEQARIIAMANGELFGYGALDTFFDDETVTTISLEGARKVSVRHGASQDLITHDAIFEDTPHMRRIMQRLLRDAGAELRDDVPIIETGLVIRGRRVSMSIIVPPFVPEIAVDIRVHPRDIPTAQDWIEQGILTQKTYELLTAIIASEQGLMIVGDTESGKTTLTSILLQNIDTQHLIAVERASELFLPDGATRLTTQWAVGNRPEITFGEQIRNALDSAPDTLVIDEIRNDNPQAVAPLLTEDHAPRQIWSVRGASEAKRLTSALGMLARMADGSQPEHMVYQLQNRLPFVVIIKRRKGQLQVREVAEWQFPETPQADDFVYGDFVSLMRVEWDACALTGRLPQRALDLPDDFWG